ncbi:hypothetical protein [Streptomyces sp. NPDC088915]|uniref:hypothetical protein n=1 Tax=Streptomyces sp. NPDC088915 TaxID=3365912 RepID=UPI003827AEC2
MLARLVGGGLPGQVRKREKPAAGLVHGGLFLGLLAQALLALAFVGFGLRLVCDGPGLAVLAQVRARLAFVPPAAVANRLPPVVGELLPALLVDRPPRLPLLTAAFLSPSPCGLAPTDEVGVPGGLPIVSSSG